MGKLSYAVTTAVFALVGTMQVAAAQSPEATWGSGPNRFSIATGRPLR